MTQKRLFLIDGSALVYRAFFAFIKNPLLNSRGENTSAAFGFINALLGLLEREDPDEIAVVFDASGPNFRHQMYPEYKATREKMPDELAEQLPVVRYLTKALGIKVIHQSGVEADDIIGTLAKRGASDGADVMIVSGDKDFAQLVTEKIKLYDPGKSGKGVTIVAAPDVKEKYGVEPSQIIDYMALVGDSSDNVPGVPKVGPKTAQKLIEDYGSLDQLYASLDKVSGSMRDRLTENKDLAYLSKDLVTIRTDIEIKEDVEDLARGDVDAKELRRLFSDLEFHSLLDRVAQIVKGGETLAPQQAQGQYHLIRDLDGLLEVIEICKEAGQLLLHPLFEYNDQGARYHALALAHGPQEAWIAVLPQEESSSSQETETPSPAASSATSSATSSAAPLAPKASPAPKAAPSASAQLGLFGSVFEPAPVIASSDAPSDASASTSSSTQPMTWKTCLQTLKPLLEDPNIPKIGHDLKETILLLYRYGIQLKGLTLDTLIGAYLLNPSRPNQELDSLALQLLSYRKMQPDDVRGSGRKRRPWEELEPSEIVRFLGEEIDVVARLVPVLKPQLEESDIVKLMDELENPLIPILAKMEQLGVALDIPLLQKMHDEMDTRLQAMMAEIQTYAEDPEFNVNSSQQVAQLLYEKLKIHEELGVELRKTKKGTGFSTNSETLEQLTGHPLPRLILDYRELQKLLSTYIDALPAQATPDEHQIMRIHTRFRQAHTATGRLSSFSPNLQNIPTRTEQGREIRKAFVCGDPAWKILSADYSQVELRLLAHISEDPVLIDAFHKGIDIHARTAGLIFDVPAEEVTSSQRSAAKAINFGIIYGMGPPRLAKEINVSVDDAGHFIKAYFKSYPKVKNYLEGTIESAKKLGYVETLSGRRRYVHDLDSKDPRVRAASNNIAVNTPIQGSAADLIKRAMIRIANRMEQQALSAKMLLQIHDELLFEVPPHEIELLSQILHEEMEQAMSLRVPLVVDIGHGANWAEAH
ncbi:MAG: DNA polymerase I [Myxococcales bacterium]|nr:DNA polymerase I [Myxococcales bacterium]